MTTTAITRPGAGRRRRFAAYLQRHRWPLLFVSPFFIAFVLFYLYPYAVALVLPWMKWNGVQPMTPIGLGNLNALLLDPRFQGSIVNTGIMWLLYGPLTVLLGAILANLLNSRYARLRGLWLIVLILPSVTSMVAAGFTFKLLLEPEAGLANQVLQGLGLPEVPWLTDVGWARVSVAVLVMWGTLGMNTVLLLAALQAINPEVVEAARCDGCSSAGAFRHVTLPLLRPVIVFLLVVSLIGVIELFTEPFILTSGGPIAGTETPAMRIYNAIFSQSKYGYAGAMALVLAVIILPLAFFQFWFYGRGDRAS